jgi:hypothetical protein
MFDHKWNKNYFYILFDLKEDVEVVLVPFMIKPEIKELKNIRIV